MASTVWRGYLSFGLISIPVRLFRAARAERVSLRRLYRQEAPSARQEPLPEEALEEPRPRRGKAPEKIVAHEPLPQILEPVRQASVRTISDEAVVPTTSLVKGYEFEKNRFVALEPEELKSLEPKTATEMQIEEFVSLADVDPVFFETSYYVTPEDAGQKAYALLYRAMVTTNLVAIAQFAMHSREHVVIVRPGRRGLIAHTMYFTSEVRADEEFPADASKVNEKELKLAETLIHSLAAPFEPQKYRDTYRERLESLIAQKVAGQPVTPEAPIARSAPVVDIAEALQRSLAALKKPPAAAQTAVVAKPKKRAAKA